MTLIPTFEIGIWNAWILIVIFLCFFTFTQFLGDIGKKIAHGEEEKTLSKFTALIAIILWIYSIFLPLKIGTAWLYTGISIYVLGMIIGITAIVSIAATQPGKPFTKGMYRYSRHPLSANMFLILLGIGVATASWLYLLLLAILMLVTRLQVAIEERSCIEKFGDTYREYMARTPRWIGLPKS
jgi:protein-S-isoprenylcysteine O-methyltransferase Ste14